MGSSTVRERRCKRSESLEARSMSNYRLISCDRRTHHENGMEVLDISRTDGRLTAETPFVRISSDLVDPDQLYPEDRGKASKSEEWSQPSLLEHLRDSKRCLPISTISAAISRWAERLNFRAEIAPAVRFPKLDRHAS